MTFPPRSEPVLVQFSTEIRTSMVPFVYSSAHAPITKVKINAMTDFFLSVGPGSCRYKQLASSVVFVLTAPLDFIWLCKKVSVQWIAVDDILISRLVKKSVPTPDFKNLVCFVLFPSAKWHLTSLVLNGSRHQLLEQRIHLFFFTGKELVLKLEKAQNRHQNRLGREWVPKL